MILKYTAIYFKYGKNIVYGNTTHCIDFAIDKCALFAAAI